MATLKSGETIPLLGSGQSVRILNYIAEGGQGEVYKVAYNGGEYALKWYSKIVPTDAFYANLAHNIKIGAPEEYFLWPQAITEKVKGRFGYIMRLRPSCYKEYGEFLLGDARFKSWDLLFKAALNIVESYFALHSMGYSYQDLNEGSFFINPDDGDVLICDNDNVAPFGENLGVKGMPKYMAPEVVLNKTRPNTHTDRFSLAIILFRLFYIEDINSRITEQQWREVLIKARGMLVRLDGKEQFVNAYKPETVPQGCRLLRTEEQVIALAPDSVLYKCQVDRISTDYKTPAALVKASTSNKTVYGLGNLTNKEWICTLPGKNPVSVKPKGFAPLIPGTTVDFGNIKGKVF